MEIAPGRGGAGLGAGGSASRCRRRAASWPVQPTAAPTTRNGRGARARDRGASRHPRPAPGRTNALAAAMASGTVGPRARYAAMAAESEQPGAMVVAGGHPLAGQHHDPVGAGHDVIRRLGEVASLHHDLAGAACPGSARPRPPAPRACASAVDVGVAQHGGLAQVRGGDERVGQEPLEVGRDPVGLHQPVPGGGDQHGVDHEAGEAALARRGRPPQPRWRRWPACRSSRCARRSRRARSRPAGARSPVRAPRRRAPRPCSAPSPRSARTCRARCSAAKVLRSACAPAPPPESDPAMVSAVGGVAVRHRATIGGHRGMVVRVTPQRRRPRRRPAPRAGLCIAGEVLGVAAAARHRRA